MRAMRHRAAAVCLALLLGPAGAASAAPELAEGITIEDYNEAGRDLHQTLSKMAKAFAANELEALAGYVGAVEGPVQGWTRAELPASAPGLVWWRWEAGEERPASREALVDLLTGWRESLGAVEQALFKVHLVDVVRADRDLEARLRVEVVNTAPEGGRQVENGLLATTWAREGDALRLTSLRPLEGDGARGPGDLFRDEAAARGIDFHGDEDPRFAPPSDALRYQVIRHAVGGASAGDVDGDGADDVVLTSGTELRLFRNQGDGTFADATAAAGLTGVLHANATLLVDLDSDGDQDLYVARFYGHNLLYENTGDGRFRDVTEGSGLAQDDMTGVLCAADVDGDGHLDLYLGRYIDARTEVPDAILYSRNAAPNRLYLGRGDLTFEDVTAGSGADDVGLTLGIGAADYDRDGDQDLYLSNDYGRNVLLQNQGDGTFADVALESGTLAVSGGMSTSWGDYDRDGWLDIYVSSIRSNQRWFSQDVNIRAYILNIVQSERRDRLQDLFLDLKEHLGEDWDRVGQLSLGGNYLLRNAGDGTFEDVSDAARARPQGWYWSSGFFDVDNDGDADVVAVDGWITGEKTHDL